MSQSLQAIPNKLTLATLVKEPVYAQAFKRVLKDGAEQFVSSLIQIGNSLPADVDPRTIVGAAMTAAALDLPINKNLGFAWIVPYKGRAQFQMGWKGFVQLALRTGQYDRLNAKPINAAAFQGWDEIGEPRIDWTKLDETEPEIGYAFAWRLTNGFTKICYWPRAKVEAHARRYSQAYRGEKETPWKTHFTEMALKTVVKNELAKWGILSIQMQKAQVSDQAVIADVDAEPQFIDDDASAKAVGHSGVEEKGNATGLPANTPNDSAVARETAREISSAPVPQQDKPAISEMRQLLKDNDISFDLFRRWGEESGNIPDASSYADLMEMPSKTIERLLKAKVGLIQNITLYKTTLRV